MQDLATLTEEIRSIDQQTVAPSGVTIGKSLLASIADKGGSGQSTTRLADTEIAGDLGWVFEEEDLAPFWEGELLQRVRRLCGEIELTDPLMRELLMLRANNPVQYHHSLATTAITLRVVMEILVKAKDLARVGRANLLKDIGITRLPANLWRNRDHLTRQEFHQICKHPIVGLVLCTYYLGEGIEGMVALRHHMRNGNGYPKWRNLKPSRLIDIIECIDVFYALISPRPFRPEPFDVRGALDEITQLTERDHLAEHALKLLIAVYRSDKPEIRKVALSDERKGFVPEDNFYGLESQ